MLRCPQTLVGAGRSVETRALVGRYGLVVGRHVGVPDGGQWGPGCLLYLREAKGGEHHAWLLALYGSSPVHGGQRGGDHRCA